MLTMRIIHCCQKLTAIAVVVKAAENVNVAAATMFIFAITVLPFDLSKGNECIWYPQNNINIVRGRMKV